MPTALLAPERVEAPDAGQTMMIDAAEIARLLGLSARTVNRLLDAGRMPAPVRIGGSRRWRRTVIETWIAEGCPAATTSAR